VTIGDLGLGDRRVSGLQAVTVNPFGEKVRGGRCSASVSASDQKARRDSGSRGSPSWTPSRRRSRTARSIAMHHSTQLSPASGSAWVSSATALAASAIASSSPRWASATAAVRISAPLPAAPFGWSAK
jgi:hypothetical protein